MKRLLVMGVLGMAAVFAAEPTGSVLSQAAEGDFKMIEREFVPLVEAMPADKFHFAPTQGEFKGVRTFSQEASHVAAVLFVVGAAICGEPAKDMGKNENGPDTLKTKEDVVAYVKAAFAYVHKAIATMNDRNAVEMIKSPFGNKQVPRMSMATAATWHTFDHYGQMVEYARMNGIVPPASR